MNLRRILTLGGSILSGLIVLGLDVMRSSVDLDVTGLMLIREVLVIAAFVLLYAFLELSETRKAEESVQKLGLLLVVAVVVALMTSIIMFTSDATFEAKEGRLLPLGFNAIVLASFVSLSFGLLSIILFRHLRVLTLYKRKKGTQRNLMIQIVLTLVTALSTVGLDPLENTVVTSVLFGLAIGAMVMNSFRLSWIVYLSKREKVFSLVYSFLLFGVMTYLNVLSHGKVLNEYLLYHSYPVREFSALTLIFGNIYFGMAFVSTLFHLPTAEAFERKTTEITSLHNLGRLINQVFDFNELVDTVTSMTLQVCEAKACWLEMVHGREGMAGDSSRSDSRRLNLQHPERYLVQAVGMKNIQLEEIEDLLPYDEHTLRDVVIQERKPLVVDDLSRDGRVKGKGRNAPRSGSLVVVPLMSHTGMIGILYATKEMEFGFFKDDVEVISAFADQATIAIENSRLIDESLERERLMQEMRLAQEMQKRLLPQALPTLAEVQLDAVSTPAFEVGGDYYDVVMLEGDRLGIVVGDVSGKGVSAAFYMSEVKGIFQALSKIHRSPREFLIEANNALASSIDRRSFVSLIYGILELRTGLLTISRAGHCPMVLSKKNGVTYVRPSGMGLGLSIGPAFADAIEDLTLQLDPSDVCVFYTDGLTEARRGEEEFGYDRLLESIERLKEQDAPEIKNGILGEVKAFVGNETPHDDLTVVVLKWCKTAP